MPARCLREFVALGSEALVEFFAAAIDVVFRDSRLAQVDRLSERAQHIYLGYVLNAEVLNGGLSQFFSNTSGNRVAETLEALRCLDGATTSRCWKQHYSPSAARSRRQTKWLASRFSEPSRRSTRTT